MRSIPKDRIRFLMLGEDNPSRRTIEIRILPGGSGGWEARVVLISGNDPEGVPLGRVFRSSDRSLATGKMVRWVRGKFPDAHPLSEISRSRHSPQLFGPSTYDGP